MTTFKKGEVYLAEIVFTDGSATKKRPIVIISGKHFNEKREEVVIAPITSNIIRKIYGDVTIKHWESAGLLFPSAVTGIITTVKKFMLGKKIGQLEKDDQLKVDECMRKNLELVSSGGKK